MLHISLAFKAYFNYKGNKAHIKLLRIAIWHAKVLANLNFLYEVCTPVGKNYRDTGLSGAAHLPYLFLFHQEYPDVRGKPGDICGEVSRPDWQPVVTIGIAVVAR